MKFVTLLLLFQRFKIPNHIYFFYLFSKNFSPLVFLSFSVLLFREFEKLEASADIDDFQRHCRRKVVYSRDVTKTNKISLRSHVLRKARFQKHSKIAGFPWRYALRYCIFSHDPDSISKSRCISFWNYVYFLKCIKWCST